MKKFLIDPRIFMLLLLAIIFAFGASVAQATGSCGPNCYSEEETALGTTAITFTFGFSATDVHVEVDGGNADDVCIHWASDKVAVCPAADTAGDDRVSPGVTIGPSPGNFAGSAISVIGDSSCSTCTVTVRAYRR